MTADIEVTVVVPGDLAEEFVAGSWLPASHDARVADSREPSELRCYSLLAAAVKRAPRPIEVGDTVRYASDQSPRPDEATVHAIVKGSAACTWRSNRFTWSGISDLTRVDPTPAEEAP